MRALTRDPNAPAAKALAAAGAEVVAADVDDPASLKRAFAGAYGAYCVTFFWAHFSPEKELAQAKALAEAAKSAGLKHVIWSTLEDTRTLVPLSDDRMPTLQGKYKVPHFDAKGEADRFFRDAGVPTTFLLTSFYWDNFVHFGSGPKKGPDGDYLLTLPIGRREDGRHRRRGHRPLRLRHLQGGARATSARRSGIAGEHLTGDEMAAALSQRARQDRRATTRWSRRCSAASAFPAPTTSATCSSSIATSPPS